MIKRKFFKTIALVGVIAQLSFSSTVFAQENNNLNADTSVLKSREVLINSLPEEEQEVIEDGQGEIIGESYEFFEYQLNESGKAKILEAQKRLKSNSEIGEQNLLDSKDYTIVKSDLETFKERQKSSAKISLGLNASSLRSATRPDEVAPGYWVSEDLTNPVIMHGIKVMRNSSNNRRFTATSSFTWSRAPYMNSTDAMGITCSPTMVAITNTKTAYAEAFIPVANNPTIRENIVKEGPIVERNGIGVAASITPRAAATTNTGFIRCDFEFATSDTDVGIITSEYLKKSISVDGSLSFDSSGRPSLGLETTSTRYSKAVNIYKYNE